METDDIVERRFPRRLSYPLQYIQMPSECIAISPRCATVSLMSQTKTFTSIRDPERLVDALLEEAILRHASDLYFIPSAQVHRICLRGQGRLNPLLTVYLGKLVGISPS